MRIRTVHTIFRKELTDTLRDRRTLIFMLLVPIAGIPLLMMAMSELMTSRITEEMERTSVVIVQGMEFLPDDLRNDFANAESFTIAPDSTSELNDMIEKVKSGEADALVLIPKSFDKAIAVESPTEVEIFYDKAEMRSGFTVDKLESVLSSYRDKTISARLRQRDMSEDIVKPFEIVSQNVATAKKMVGEGIGAMLPYLIILMCFTGAMYPAIDLAAGEKERGTLETLLVSPASRGEFVVGKYLVILTTGIVAALLSLASLTYSMKYMVGGLMSMTTEALPVEFDLSTVILVLMIVLPLAGIFAAILLSISIFARSFKEAQSYISVMTMVILLPAFVSILPGTELNYKLALIPVVNVSVIIKEAISGTIEWNYVIVAFVSMIVLAAATLYFAKKWFERESILFRM